MSILDQVFQLFRQQGDSMYGGEAVTQTEHALQCAWLAEQKQAASSLVAAALLHDVGHLLHDLGDDCADEGIDDVHQARGADWLSDWFGRLVWARGRPAGPTTRASKTLSLRDRP